MCRRAIAAVLLDAGYPLLAIKGVPMLARTASLIAHLLEEQQRPIGFVLAHAGAAAIGYDGRCPHGFVPGEELTMQPVLRGVRDRGAGHVHHRPVRRHDARRSRRRT